jgi:hypothetical protein
MWNDPEHDPSRSSWSAEDEHELESWARLYREHPPSDPDWAPTLDHIESRLHPSTPSRRRWPIFVGFITAAAALFAGVVLARTLWPTPTPPPINYTNVVAMVDDEEPYPVALLSEVEILRAHPDDVDRIMMGALILGSVEFASFEDIVLVSVEPDPDEGRMPRMQKHKGSPMIIVARVDDDEEP